jgi:lipoprotein-anchoring transpeptidase ErfK/SrfK
MRVRLPLVAVLTAAAIAAPQAVSQVPDPTGTTGPTGPTGPTTAPAAQPADAKLSVGVVSVGDRKRRWVLAGQDLVAVGRLDPFVEGEKVAVSLYRGKRRLGTRTVEVKQSSKGGGKFSATFGAVKRPGSYHVVAKHQGTDKQKAATSERTRFGAVRATSGNGSNGQHVRLLQIGLRRLAFVAPLNGRHDAATGRAVMAYRKTNGMARTTSANRNIMASLFRGKGGFRLKFPKAGKHVEVDLSRAVLVLADKGRPQRIYHTSPGKASTPTVTGTYRVYRRQPGTNAVGMLHSSYFIRGYAIHGYPSVPAYPASHGCVRVPNSNALSIYRWIKLGDRIDVYP